MHKLGGEGKEQGREEACYSQGVEPQGWPISLILYNFFPSSAAVWTAGRGFCLRMVII